MSEISDCIVVLTTVENIQDAEKLASLLVDAHLAACVQILPRIKSIYRWQSSVQQSDEFLIIIKTTSLTFPLLESFIKQHHPYQTPEIIALPIIAGSIEYLEWLAGSVKPNLHNN